MRRQELWCPHTIGLLAPPSQTHGCIPCAAAAVANEAVAVKTRSDVLDRAGRWHSYSQPCGWALGLEQPLLGIQVMEVMIEWGQTRWLLCRPKGSTNCGKFWAPGRRKRHTEKRGEFPGGFFGGFFSGPKYILKHMYLGRKKNPPKNPPGNPPRNQKNPSENPPRIHQKSTTQNTYGFQRNASQKIKGAQSQKLTLPISLRA